MVTLGLANPPLPPGQCALANAKDPGRPLAREAELTPFGLEPLGKAIRRWPRIVAEESYEARRVFHRWDSSVGLPVQDGGLGHIKRDRNVPLTQPEFVPPLAHMLPNFDRLARIGQRP